MTRGLRFKALVRDRRGATAVEYGLILSMIVIAMLVALKNVANANTRMWNKVEHEVLNKA